MSRADGVIEEANAAAAALLGASEQLANTALAEHLAGDAQPALQKALQTVLAGARHGSICTRNTGLAGCSGHTSAAWQPATAMQARARSQWTLHDVTDHAEIERQRSDLTDMVLHDLVARWPRRPGSRRLGAP